MSNIKNKQGSSKKKTIIIVSSVLVVLIGLGAGLGVAFGGTSGKASDTINANNNTGNGGDGTKIQATSTEGTYWKVVKEKDPNVSTSQLKTLRIKKEAKTEKNLKEVYNEMVTQKVDLTSFNELLIPYHLKDAIGEDKTKEILHLKKLTANQFGYVFNKKDYEKNPNVTHINQGIVEVNLPETTETIIESQFMNNKIRMVNWSELTSLKSTGKFSFSNNVLRGDLDLSVMTELVTIGGFTFNENILSGTLILPRKIEEIGQRAFSAYDPRYHVNKIKGTLKLPKTLIVIGSEAFAGNEIEVIDWSEADELKYIKDSAFINNKLKTLQFSANVLPKIQTIESAAFFGNTGQNADHELFTSNFTLPTSLKTIGIKAIKVKNGITITISTNSTGVNVDSFEGTPIIA